MRKKTYTSMLAWVLAAGMLVGNIPIDAMASNATVDVEASEDSDQQSDEKQQNGTSDKETPMDDTSSDIPSEDKASNDTDAGDGSSPSAGASNGSTPSIGTPNASTPSDGEMPADETPQDRPEETEDGVMPADTAAVQTEETWTITVDPTEGPLLEGDKVTITVTLNENVRHCETFQYRIYVDVAKFAYVKDSLNSESFSRELVMSRLMTDKDTGKTYYYVFPKTIGEVADMAAGTSFSLQFEASEDMLDVDAVSDCFTGVQHGELVKGSAYKILMSAADAKTAVGENAVVEAVAEAVSETSGRPQYSAFQMELSYEPEKLRLATTSLGEGYELTDQASEGTIVIQWKGELKDLGTLFSLEFTTLKPGTAVVNVVSAQVDDQAKKEDGSYAGVAEDTPDAAFKDAWSKVTLTAGYAVTLPTGYTGSKIAEPGKAYAFRAPSDQDTEHYTYTLTASSGEKNIPVNDLGRGVYRIAQEDVDALTGAVTVTSTAVPEEYTVSVNGDGEADVTMDKQKAAYLTAFVFRVKEDQEYSRSVTVKVGETQIALSKAAKEGAVEYTIPAASVTDAITITVGRTVKTTQITFSGSGTDAVQGNLTQNVPNNEDFRFALTKDAAYEYTVKIGEQELLETADGAYVIQKALLTGTALTVQVAKAEKPATIPEEKITVSSYLTIDGKQWFLIRVDEEPEEGKTLYCGDEQMFWSQQAEVYVWLVSSEQSEQEVEEAVKGTISKKSGEDQKLTVAGDVNGSGKTDVNDAQFVYGIYNQKYTGEQEPTVRIMLEADVNGDGVINVSDAAAVVGKILNP